jgi:hypothetical protein
LHRSAAAKRLILNSFFEVVARFVELGEVGLNDHPVSKYFGQKGFCFVFLRL